MEWNRGTIGSALLHGVFILWVILGDWLFAAKNVPEIPVAEVSLLSSSEFDALSAAVPVAPAIPEAPPLAASEPPPQRPAPTPEPALEILPQAEVAQPIPAPVPEAPSADEAQPIPVPTTDIPPAPRDIDRVADTPVDDTTDTPDIAETPTPQVSDQPAEVVVDTPPEEAASPEAATTQIVTEAVETQADAPQLAPTTSRRPQGRPAAAEPPPVEPDIDTAAVDDAVAAALAEAAAEPATAPAEQPTTQSGSSGPPMSNGEKDALRVAIKQCWNLGTVSSEAMRTTVTVFVALAQDGTPDLGSLRMIGSEGGSAASADKMFEVARRAIARCGNQGFPLPPEKYETWKELELVFDPNGMRLR